VHFYVAKMSGPIVGGFSKEEAQRALTKVKVDLDKLGVRFEDFVRGMNVEREHKDLVQDAKSIAKIALAHLREDPHYYQKLAKIEVKKSVLYYATPAGHVRAPSDRAGLSGKMAAVPTKSGLPRTTIEISSGTFSGTSGVPESKRSPWPNQYRADRAPPNPYPGRASRNPTVIPINARMTAVNGDDLEGKAGEGVRGSVGTLRYEVALDKRVPMDEALYQAPDARLRAPRTQRCAECLHFERIGQRRSGKCSALQDDVNARHRATVEGDGYCILFRPDETVKSLAVHPRRMVMLRDLVKGFGAPDVQARGSAPRWETPPIPDYQDIYYQPEDDEKKKKEREQQETRRRSVQRRNRGVFGFHGLAYRGKPDLRYDPEDTLASVDAQAPKRPGNCKPLLVAQKMLPRFEAGQSKLVARRK
jgi:Protein of unknown function (DUF5661)